MTEPRTLVITGASRGLGAFMAEAALAAGYRVVGLARSVPASTPVNIRVCDVGDADQVSRVFKDLRSEGSLYGLVNAAGIASMNLVLSTPSETMERIVRTNLLGTMYCNAAMGRLLARRRRGRIINFSTIAVPLALQGEAAYVASKAGVEGFSRSFAREMADFDVTVNVVAPGPIATDLIGGVPAGKIAALVDRQILRRNGTRQDVWDSVAFLLSEQASMVSGQVVNVGGA